jgi:hypothetical protein
MDWCLQADEIKKGWKKRELKRFGEAVDATLNGAVQDVIADLDAETAEELGVDFVFDDEFIAVVFGEACDHFLTLRWGECGCAFDDYRAAGFFKTHEALNGREDCAEITRLGGDKFGNQITQLVIIKLAVHLAQAEEAASGSSGDFGDFHRCLVRKEIEGLVADFSERLIVDAGLVSIGEDFAGDLRGRACDEATKFTLQFSGNALTICVCSGFSFHEDLLSL